MDAKLEQLETTLNNINVFNAGKKREEAVALLAQLLPEVESFQVETQRLRDTIAHELGLSPRTVQRALADLEHRQLIEKRQRHRANGSLTSNLYRLTAAKKSQPPAKGGL